MFGADGVRDGLDDLVAFEFVIASNRRSNSVLQMSDRRYPEKSLVITQARCKCNVACGWNGEARAANGHTFFGGPPEWKCGLRISFAKASRSTLRVFLRADTGVMRLIHRLFLVSGWACASVHRRWTSDTGSMDLSSRTNVTAGD